MPRLIDAEKLVEYKAGDTSFLTERQEGWNYAIDTIMDETPTVDAEPVIRCKNCKHYYAWDAPLVGGFCFHDGIPMLNIEPMHYCSWGEKRKDETD